MTAKLIARALVLLKAAPTYLVAASSVVTIAADEVSKVLPDQAQAIGAWSLRIVGVIGAAVGIVRRVTPVLEQDRGLLPAGQ